MIATMLIGGSVSRRKALIKSTNYPVQDKGTITELIQQPDGEAESVASRLRQHDKREWNQVAVFVSKNENLTQADTGYLEGALIILAG